MLRTFHEHKIRPVDSLDGHWTLSLAEEPNAPDTIYVPSAWESIPGLENYRGKGTIARNFKLTEAANVRLVFGGVSHTANVKVDGEFICTHYDAFTPFEAVVRGLDAGAHTLEVEVDNSFGDHSALHKENDYYTYGGITRPVEIQLVPDTFIDKIYATPRQEGSAWSLDLRVTVNGDAEGELNASIAGKTVSLTQNDDDYSATITGLDVEAWTNETPKLYDLTVQLNIDGKLVDDKIDRIGFRTIAVDGKRLLLNGNELRLRGYNRHEDHPQFGNAIPVQAMVQDLEIMRDLGCNFVRTCHYPNDMRFLDLCDELGFYVWEESHARAVPFDPPKFDEQIEASTREMLEWHYNRPGIVMWGCLNECDSKTEEGKEVYSRVLGQLKDFDPSRPITFASNRNESDICQGLVDIVSVNVYTGWYHDPIERIGPRIDELLGWLHSDASHGGSGKPVIVSEFGGGAVYGNRQRCRSHWSEEYQCDVLDECLRVYLNHPDIVGAAIWQFCDVRVTETWWNGRPRTLNNKGTVDEYRRPKLAYDTVKRRMLEAAGK